MSETHPIDSPLPKRARALLQIVHALAEDWLERAIRKGLESFDQHVFRGADSEQDVIRRKQFLTALDGLDRSRKACWPRFRELLQRAVGELHLRAHGQPYGESAKRAGLRLSILSDAEMEASLVLAEFGSYAEMHHSRTLHQLGMRLGVLARAPALPIEHNPFGPKTLCECLKAAADVVNVPEELRVVLLRHLGRQIFDGLGANLKALNESLIEQGVLPNTIVLAPRRARSKGPRPARAAATTVTPEIAANPADAGPPAASVGPPASDASPPAPASGEIFTMLRALLAMQALREVPAGGSTAATPQPSITDLLQTLTERRQAHVSPEATRVEGLSASGSARPAALSLPPGVAEAAAQADASRLVELLVGSATAPLPGNSNGRQLLERLKPAMARLAVRDPAVFTDRTHPARQLLGRLSGPARDWIDHNADPALLKRVAAVVEDIASRPYPTAEVFRRAVGDLDTQLGELRRQAAEGERHQVQAADEHERLAHAALHASAAMRELLQSARRPSRLVRTLLEQAWTDVLVMAMLASGTEALTPGTPAGERLAVARQLLEADARATRELPLGLRPLVVDGLASIGHDPKDIESLCIRLFEPDRTADDDSIASPTELAMRLKARSRIADSAAAPAPALPGALSAIEESASRALAKVPVGTWMEFLRPPPDGNLHLKLAWISPRSGRCLFVDARGRRALDTTLQHLARGQARGQLRVLPTDGPATEHDPWDQLIASLAGRVA
ncbi:MAG: DUF1631 domain-containing protein [Xanthomonadales bacterium]|jgi:hypothetical protein|nr:DUF1631 domain-containing protein [Xanthomonadales bacterium]